MRTIQMLLIAYLLVVVGVFVLSIAQAFSSLAAPIRKDLQRLSAKKAFLALTLLLLTGIPVVLMWSFLWPLVLMSAIHTRVLARRQLK